jgi:hypothetical protein
MPSIDVPLFNPITFNDLIFSPVCGRWSQAVSRPETFENTLYDPSLTSKECIGYAGIGSLLERAFRGFVAGLLEVVVRLRFGDANLR